MVKNPPANAGDSGSIPDPGRSHMPWEQLSPGATTTNPGLESPGAAALHLCSILCDPMDCSLQGFSVHGIL